jgi:hypothetical protein
MIPVFEELGCTLRLIGWAPARLPSLENSLAAAFKKVLPAPSQRKNFGTHAFPLGVSTFSLRLRLGAVLGK